MIREESPCRGEAGLLGNPLQIRVHSYYYL